MLKANILNIDKLWGPGPNITIGRSWQNPFGKQDGNI